ncbi:hypothetical protein CPB86DRAFT_791837 [Serendipita vermifera]|nr:hypothetical protein CPB86DRAFT_791837 [Serendipita vermifera]
MDIPTKKKYSIRSLIFSSIAWIVVMTVISKVTRIWKPQRCLSLESVSGFYGPGAYWAWVLTILSAIVDMVSSNEGDRISPDFVAACLYTLVAMVDIQFRFKITRHIDRELQLQAALHIVYTALSVSSLAFVLGQYLCERKPFDLYVPPERFSGPWKFRIWAPFMLLTTIQTLSAWHTAFGVDPESDAKRFAVLLYMSIIFFYSNWFIKLSVCALLLWYWVYDGVEPVRRGKLLWPTSAPHTGSSILDMDQIAGLVTTVVLLSIYWKPWRPVMRFPVYLKRAIQSRR